MPRKNGQRYYRGHSRPVETEDSQDVYKSEEDQRQERKAVRRARAKSRQAFSIDSYQSA